VKIRFIRFICVPIPRQRGKKHVATAEQRSCELERFIRGLLLTIEAQKQNPSPFGFSPRTKIVPKLIQGTI
jgi:hypothetical protein